MITLRRAEERHLSQDRGQESWLTFFPPDDTRPAAEGLGPLVAFDECRLPPGGGMTRQSQEDVEIVTFVRQGALAWEDSLHSSGLVQAGEFRRLTPGRGRRHRDTNASQTDWAQVFQIWLHSTPAELEPSHELKRFSVAERRGRLCAVCSPDGRRGSLRIQPDVLVYSALLEPGTHLVYELAPERSAWLHLVQGEATLGDLVLTTGDGVGVRAEHAVSLTAEESSEILLLDLRDSPR